MWTGRQFTGTLAPSQARRWYTFNWPAQWHVVWYMVPTSVRHGAPQVSWDVGVERATSTRCTYWITVRNLTSGPVTFEARYAVLS